MCIRDSHYIKVQHIQTIPFQSLCHSGQICHVCTQDRGRNFYFFQKRREPAGKIDLEQLCRAMGFERVRVVDPYDLKATDQAVKEELAAREPSVIISRRPCALLKYVKHQAPLAVDTDKCVGCKSCMRIGCPAISMKEGKAHVDNTLCVGCGVCEQMCAFGAFQSTEKEG